MRDPRPLGVGEEVNPNSSLVIHCIQILLVLGRNPGRPQKPSEQGGDGVAVVSAERTARSFSQPLSLSLPPSSLPSLGSVTLAPVPEGFLLSVSKPVYL